MEGERVMLGQTGGGDEVWCSQLFRREGGGGGGAAFFLVGGRGEGGPPPPLSLSSMVPLSFLRVQIVDPIVQLCMDLCT